MTTETKRSVVLWLDSTSDSSEPAWIVSRQVDDSNDTVLVFGENDYQRAREAAIDLARKDRTDGFEQDEYRQMHLIHAAV